jgi:hypothetical protein
VARIEKADGFKAPPPPWRGGPTSVKASLGSEIDFDTAAVFVEKQVRPGGQVHRSLVLALTCRGDFRDATTFAEQGVVSTPITCWNGFVTHAGASLQPRQRRAEERRGRRPRNDHRHHPCPRLGSEVDFEDVKTVMSKPGKAMMGTASTSAKPWASRCA